MALTLAERMPPEDIREGDLVAIDVNGHVVKATQGETRIICISDEYKGFAAQAVVVHETGPWKALVEAVLLKNNLFSISDSIQEHCAAVIWDAFEAGNSIKTEFGGVKFEVRPNDNVQSAVDRWAKAEAKKLKVGVAPVKAILEKLATVKAILECHKTSQ